MAVYKNNDASAPVTSVEFTPVSDGNFAFFHVKPRDDKNEFKSWVTSPAIGQQIVAETIVDGERMFVTHGDKTKDELLQAIKDGGTELTLTQPERKINLWKWRGIMSMIGQPLQFISGWNKKGARDYSIIGFASLNMAANFVNLIFGAQKSDDTHRLKHIKNKMNDEFGEEVVTLDELIDVNDKRAEIRKDPPLPKSMGEKFYSFMQKNSVTFGEIGLRYFGGISLVAPLTRWKQAGKIMSEQSVMKGLRHALNPDVKTLRAGMGWLIGKTIAFFAKTPDPYNPEPKTTLDIIREKYLFKMSTISEMMGASYLALDRFENPNRKIILGGKEYQDYLGGIGGILFATAFAMRLNAPYGVKEVNMEEVYAHATDTLAKTPPEKLPQLMADSAATLKEHFKDKDNITYSEIYTKMMTDLYRYHHVSLDNLSTPQEERISQIQKDVAGVKPSPETPAATTTAPEAEAPQTAHATAPRKLSDRVNAPAANFAEKAKMNDGNPTLGVSA